jgi:hypothetical protein
MNIRSLLLPFALLTLVAGCQTTSIQSAWYDTNFRSGPMRKIVVVGSVDSISDGRVFEDIFAEKLRAAGVEGVAGYTVIADEARAAEAPFAAAVAKTGAQGLLLVRLLRVDTRTQVSTTMVPGGMGWGWGGAGSWSGGGMGWGSPFGPSMVPVQQVSQYDLATVESKLFDVQTKQLVWAATTTTFNPTSVARETPGFADVIIGQMAQRGIIQRK